MSDSVTPRTEADQASLSFTVSWSLLKFMSIESVMLTKHHILCRPLLLFPSIFHIRKSIRVFSNELALCIRGLKYCSFSFSISLSSEHSGLVSFGIHWFNFLAVQGTIKSSPAPRLKSVNSLMLSFLYGPTLTSICDCCKNRSLTIQTFASKVMSLLFNMLSRFVMAFSSRSKGLQILWLQSPSSVILEPKKTKSVTVSNASPTICHEVMGLDSRILVSEC